MIRVVSKPFSCFGYVIFKNDVKVGHTFNDELAKDNVFEIKDGPNFSKNYTWLYVSGKMTLTNLDTNEISVREAGFCNADTPEKTGTFKIEVVEDGTVYCLNNHWNERQIPETTPFRLMANESSELPTGTKLYLGGGTFQLSTGEEHTGPLQIRVTESPKIVTAKTNCYGLLFP